MAERAQPLDTVATMAPRCTAVQLVALPSAVRYILRGHPTLLAPVGIAVPQPCRATVDGERALLWLGPDEFLLMAPDGSTPPQVATATDVSHRDTGLTVAGPRAAWALNCFCPLDLHPTSFPAGMCTRTVFGKVGILLWRTAAETFHIEVARSLAPYVWTCLEEARREFLA